MNPVDQPGPTPRQSGAAVKLNEHRCQVSSGGELLPRKPFHIQRNAPWVRGGMVEPRGGSSKCSNPCGISGSDIRLSSGFEVMRNSPA